MNRWKQKVACPEGCGAVQRRSNMATHLAAIHRDAYRTRDAGSKAVRDLPGVEEVAAALPAVVASVPAKRGRPPRVDWAEVDPAEIALSVIGSQAPGAIPVELLAEVIAYVDHTRAIVSQLRRARA